MKGQKKEIFYTIIAPKGGALIYFIVDPSLCLGRDIVDVVDAAVQGGVTMVQYRDKDNGVHDMLQNAERLRVLLSDYKIPFVINDHVGIAQQLDLDGVHIGQGDMKPELARRLLGPEKIIGLTAFTEAHMLAIDPDVVDYVGTGPVYPTKTDKGKPVLGLENFKALVDIAPVPVVGIGGVVPENAADVMACGAQGVAMMRAISAQDDSKVAAQNFVKALM